MPEKEKEEDLKTKVVETDDGGVTVEIDKDPTAEPEKPPVNEPEPEPEPEKKPDVSTKERNRTFYQERQISKLTKQVDNLTEQLVSKKEPEKKEITDKEIDEAASTDWKKAVDLKVDEKIHKMLAERDRKIEENARETAKTTEQEENSSVVASKYGKELSDPTSDHTRIWWNVLNSHPTWQKSPQGPLLIMYEMEKELGKLGYSVDTPIKENSNERVNKVISKTLPTTRKIVTRDKVILTKEQKEFCDINGMKYETYARNLAVAGEKSEVEA